MEEAESNWCLGSVPMEVPIPLGLWHCRGSYNFAKCSKFLARRIVRGIPEPVDANIQTKRITLGISKGDLRLRVIAKSNAVCASY